MHCFHLYIACLFQYGYVHIQHIFNLYNDRKLIKILDDLMNVVMCECVSYLPFAWTCRYGCIFRGLQNVGKPCLYSFFLFACECALVHGWMLVTSWRNCAWLLYEILSYHQFLFMLNMRGAWWCSWWRHCATSWVAVSIPEGVTGIIHWLNPFSRSMALRSTWLTEIITRDILGLWWPVLRADNLATFMCQLARHSGSVNLLVS